MNKGFLALFALAALAGCSCFDKEEPIAKVTSPDGRNEVRLYVDPLAYEIFRDQVRVTGKTEIGLKVDGKCIACYEDGKQVQPKIVNRDVEKKTEKTPFYKKGEISLERKETFLDFGDWGLAVAARNDGVAYRFETMRSGLITVDCEKAPLVLPNQNVRVSCNFTGGVGQEESVPVTLAAKDVVTASNGKVDWAGTDMIYLPLVYAVNSKSVCVTEADVADYPIWNFKRSAEEAEAQSGCRKCPVTLGSYFPAYPAETFASEGWDKDFHELPSGGRWKTIRKSENFLVKTDGTRTFPWRVFILGDHPSDFCESDIVRALAQPQIKGDFAWVKPGKVAWDWWNAFDNKGEEKGCTTEGYRRFIDFASKQGVEYVIFDEGWSKKLDIWNFSDSVDVPGLIKYGEKKNVGIILWMAWAQIIGQEEKVAKHFAKLGAKGFKVDFMDRGDAEIAAFLDKFAAACAKHRMLIDYHGVYRPTGLQRKYPNILNYEGIHGLEQMKFYKGYDMMHNDVAAFYLRLSAGPMDYTPGAMDNYPVDAYPYGDKKIEGLDLFIDPGSMGTRARQMAMMALYEAPLQMLCDSPTKYEKNLECFRFMAATPVVWDDVKGLPGCPDSLAAVARKAKDGSWYVAAITDKKARDYKFNAYFLKGDREWKAEIFRDAEDSDSVPTHYVHETKTVRSGEEMSIHLAQGGGFVIRFTERK